MVKLIVLEIIWKIMSLFLYQLKIINDNGDKKTITHKLQFIDSYRFMQSSLSDLVDNTSEIFKSRECKSCKERTKINSECCFAGLKNDRLI